MYEFETLHVTFYSPETLIQKLKMYLSQFSFFFKSSTFPLI